MRSESATSMRINRRLFRGDTQRGTRLQAGFAAPYRAQFTQRALATGVVPSSWDTLRVAVVPGGVAAGEVQQLRNDIEALREELEEEMERLHDTLAALEIIVVSGYFVKVWPDLACDAWVAHCPTVRCVAQERTRSEAVHNVRLAIEDMLAALAELGEEAPARDI